MTETEQRIVELIRERLPVNRKLIAWAGVLVDWHHLETATALPQHIYTQLMDTMESKLRDGFGDAAPRLGMSGTEVEYFLVTDQPCDEQSAPPIAYMVSYAHRARGWDPSFVPR